MAIYNALISGSFAIQFFEGLRWTGSDLDIFIEGGSSARELEQYLVMIEGYRISDERDQDDEVYLAMSGIDKVRRLQCAYSYVPQHF